VSALPKAGDPEVLYLVDLSGYVFRAYHAIQTPLSAPSGEPTQATLGTITMLQRLVNQQKPGAIAVVMDSKGPTFRHVIDERYKAHRPPPPEDLSQQMERCRFIVEAYRLPVLQLDGVEADDLIATAVRGARKEDKKVVVVSADKDLMQLVDEAVVLWDTMRNKVYGVPEVIEKFGVPPEKLRDLLALMGDTSDNVPGVPSVGPKTATDLLTSYGTLEGIYENLESITRKKLKEALVTHRDEAFLSQRLVTLKDDCDVDVRFSSLVRGEPDVPLLRATFDELGFARLRDALPRSEGEGEGGADSAGSGQALGGGHAKEVLPAVERTVVTVLDEEGLSRLAAALEKDPTSLVALDVAGSNPDPLRSVLVGLAIATSREEQFYIPIGHRSLLAPVQLPVERVLEVLRSSLVSSRPLAGHDVYQKSVVLARLGVALGGVTFDGLLASYLLDPEASHTLETVAKRELFVDLVDYDKITNKVRGKQLSFDEVEVEQAAGYAAARVAAIFDLQQVVAPRLEEAGLTKLLLEVELPLAAALARMEEIGVGLDVAALAKVGELVDGKIAEMEAKAYEAAGHPFALGAPRQIETLLFDELKLPVIKRTKTARSTDHEVLEALAEEHALPALILEHRQLTKLKGTYIDALPLLVSKETGRIHTRYNQAVAATGRLSSSDPNLQNIPIRTDIGMSIRGSFVPAEGFTLLSADYSQIELRVLAHLSSDPVLVEAFRTGQDIHERTAMEIFGVAADAVTGDMRRAAKTINFGVIYGMGDSALAKRLGIPRTEAASFIASYFMRYSGVRTYMNSVLKDARTAGFVSTVLGRRRFLPDLGSGNRAVRLGAERVAQNTPIQGTAADILKLAMVALREPPVPGARMILTVHDELVFEVPTGTEDEVEAAVKRAMEGVMELSVPLVVEVGRGQTWAEAHS
jgi:DNA polymerase I